MKTPPTRFTRLKVIAGYLLLLALLLYALHYIHREVQTLRTLEEQQVLNSDSLQTLIREKDSQMMGLFRIMSRNKENTIPLDALSRLLKPQKNPPVQTQVIVRHDSVMHPRRPRSFFKRIAEVFSPGKDSVLVRTSMEISTDTLAGVHASNDSLKAHLRSEAKRNHSRQQIVTAHQTRIHQREKELTAQIDSLLHDYEQEALHKATLFNQRQQTLRNESVRAIAAIAVTGLLLAALFLAIIGRDLTRSNRYRRELEIAKRHAEELLHAREQLMLTITHDFKAPLGTIIGYAELLQPLLSGEKPEAYLQHIQNSSQHLLKLVTDLLDFHRLERHKTELIATAFIPLRFFEEITAAFLPSIHKKGLELHTHLAAGLENSRYGDVLRLRQLTDNLLSNALKFTDRGSITLHAQLNGEWLTLSIRDTGSGMDDEDREKIFRAFTRLPEAQGKEGFGLGLSIVQKLTELLEGHIEVVSRKGKGSTFTVRLPLPPAKKDAANETSTRHSTQSSTSATKLPLQGIRLLLIDDDRIQLQLTQAMLVRQGAKVDCCVQLQELTERLRNQEYDYLLTDVQMPAISGFDLLQLLRASHLPHTRKLPVIAVTARHDIQAETFTAQGFSGCLHKPFSLEELTALFGKAALTPTKCSPVSSPQQENSGAVSEKGSTENKEIDHTNTGCTTNRLSPDFRTLTSFSEEDEEGTQEIRLSFLHETEQNIEVLKEALQKEDATQIAHTAHKQLPLFTLINATECIPLLQTLEKENSGDFTPEIKSKTIRLIASERHLLDLYKTEFPSL